MRRFRRRTKSQSSTGISQTLRLRLPPTLLMRMSSPPSRSAATSMSRAAPLSSVRSPASVTAVPPALVMAAAVRSSSAPSMSPRATRAPSLARRSAISRPSPLAAPVTTATRSLTPGMRALHLVHEHHGVSSSSAGSARGMRARPKISPKQPRVKGSCHQTARESDIIEPMASRVDPAGAIWTVDAATSTVRKFTPRGATLLQIDVGGQPAGTGSRFNGATDVAFGPDGRVFIADGYGNARILEYTTRGRKVREWGSPGSGPGQFRLPHSIAVDGETIYVADRENGRIQLFDLEGTYLDEFPIGKTYSVQVAGGSLWASVHPLDLPTASPGWLVKLDRETGAILGYVEVAEKLGLHFVEATPEGEPMTEVA